MGFSENLKLLRQRKGWSQQEVADTLGVKRSSWSAYENGASEPNLTLLQKITALYGVTLDALVCEDFTTYGESKWSELNHAMQADVRGQRLRILATTVDRHNKERIETVPVKAKAGYTAGYSDPEFIAELPHIELPFLDRNRKYRCFEISGDSMPPVHSGSYVVGEYLTDWSGIKPGTPCIVVTQSEGIVFKRVHARVETHGSFLLESTNAAYPPYFVDAKEVLEMWKFCYAIESVFDAAPVTAAHELPEMLQQMRLDIADIKRRLED